MNRRQFLVSVGAVGAGLALPAAANTPATPSRPLKASSIWVDGQGALDGLEPAGEGKLVPTQRLIDAIKQRRIDLISLTIAEVGNGPSRFQGAVESITWWDQLIQRHSKLFAKIESAADIRAAREAGKLGLIYNFQDTTPFEADPDKVATFATLGVKVMQLTYNKRNIAGDGCLERANAGLSDFGREVIAKINEANVLLDLSHAGQRTIAEGIAESKAPLAITHSGCRALVDLPRNVHDAELRALAAKGGVFGVYLMPFIKAQGQPGTEDLQRHLAHAVNVCGEDHVGIGTDNPLMGYTIDDKMREEHRKFFESRTKRGIAAPGETADVFNLVEGYNSVDRYDRLAADLRALGWSSARVDKVLGGNFVRLFREVWKA
ncbi:dipeptidase [Hyalangium rubrum]|uniref:Membrane dipeptidase n=1 Tax=Hyalangium rubrum TaxID=3103134 RepID=A0ABU5H3Q0_9BACT|nr:membrane dipeptidase [Hyalangium sp. s54d21]MDY7227519.1 membrane dipeptidase [Hyalangium sp. s54d21]